MKPYRRFLTRVEATYQFGLMDASLQNEPPDFRVAVRDKRSGEVHEAEPFEVLHAQIVCRVGLAQYESGWTIPGDGICRQGVRAALMHLVSVQCKKPGAEYIDGMWHCEDHAREKHAIKRGQKNVRIEQRPHAFMRRLAFDRGCRGHTFGTDYERRWPGYEKAFRAGQRRAQQLQAVSNG